VKSVVHHLIDRLDIPILLPGPFGRHGARLQKMEALGLQYHFQVVFGILVRAQHAISSILACVLQSCPALGGSFKRAFRHADPDTHLVGVEVSRL
jgi:hypothetical protein